ncbi:hypothetical protein Tco_1217732 [Tanacetum coccineum]
MAEAKSTKKIDWNDPSVIRYHSLKMKPKIIAQEEDAKKEELKGFLDIIPREEVPIEVESVSTKFPIVDWKTCVLTETFMYYQVFRGDGKWISNSYVDREEISFKPRMISKMLKKKLEVDHESSQAIELLRFIRSQVQK